jgi:UDP-N-acetylglucosamine acyltransferase
MTGSVHPTAVLDPGARLGPDVRVGPFAVIGPGVEVGRGTRIGPHAVIEQDTSLGERCLVGAGAVLGSDPQDVSYRGEPTRLEIGHGTRIREYATLHRGTAASGRTIVGSCCYLMAYVHVAHDCILEDGVVIANAVQLAGHVHVEAHATIGGLTPVHQFVRIGRHAFVGGGSRVPQDIPPYARAAGNPIRLYGVNRVGLDRAGLPAETQAILKHAFRLLFNSHLTTTEAAERVRIAYGDVPEVVHLLDFVARSRRGVLV